ncbi:hypothetical protein MXB_5061, partial [Myxobolus squamalis]
EKEKRYKIFQNLISSFESSGQFSEKNDSSKEVYMCAIVCKIERGFSNPPLHSDSILSWLYYAHSFYMIDDKQFYFTKIISNMRKSIFRLEENHAHNSNINSLDETQVWLKYNNKSSIIFALYPFEIVVLSNHDIHYDPLINTNNIHAITCSFVANFSKFVESTTDLNLLLFLRQIFLPFYHFDRN